MDGIHDLGGMHGFGAVVAPGGEAPYHERWEARVFALHLLVELERLGARPGGRATREQMDPVDYLAASYYERWLWSVEQGLLRKGTIAAGEVERMMEQRVRVRRMRPAGHTRCPRYVRGALGVVEGVRGAAELPDLAVYGKDAPVEAVYAVAFRSDALWGRGEEPPWTVALDLWESYLEEAE
jgi:nitrile hydratase